VHNVLIFGNKANGIFSSGAISNAVVENSGGDGVDLSPGTVTNSVSEGSTGDVYDLSSSCYLGIDAGLNGGTQINGGVAMAGTVASCP
jgi:hypothetical protein